MPNEGFVFSSFNNSYKLALAIAEHMARQRLADLFLDTTPYNAGATAAAALWSGVPLLTVLGSTFVGRMAASMLHAIGLPELVAESLSDYEALALQIATHPAFSVSLRRRLASENPTIARMPGHPPNPNRTNPIKKIPGGTYRRGSSTHASIRRSGDQGRKSLCIRIVNSQFDWFDTVVAPELARVMGVVSLPAGSEALSKFWYMASTPI